MLGRRVRNFIQTIKEKLHSPNYTLQFKLVKPVKKCALKREKKAAFNHFLITSNDISKVLERQNNQKFTRNVSSTENLIKW